MSKFKVGDKIRTIPGREGLTKPYDKEVLTVVKYNFGNEFLVAEHTQSHYDDNWELAPKEKEKRWLVGSSIFGTLNDAKKLSAGERLILEVEIVAHHIPTPTITWEKKEF